MKKENSQTVIGIIIVIIIILCRFVSVLFVPDVFCDEEDILMHISILIDKLKNLADSKLPLYEHVGAGYVTYPFLYPMAILCTLVGTSAKRVRCVLQCVTIFSCFLTAKGVQLWTDKKESFWYTFIVALTIPWGFVQSNRIWDPAFVPFYFSIVFYFYCRFFQTTYGHRMKLLYEAIIFGGLVMLAVVYPPNRIPAVAMWIYLLVFGIREKRISVKDIVYIVIVSIILSLPLAYYILCVPEFNSRSFSLMTFQGEDYKQEIFIFLRNLFELLSPTYLFVSGDVINRHSMPVWGMLGTINIVAVIAWMRSKMDKIDYFLIYTIIWTFISTACTNEYQPHTLRACLAWMPFVILIARGWQNILENKGKWYKRFWYACYIIFFVIYFVSYICYYAPLRTA